MAKYRRRRYGFKKRIGKWSPNIDQIIDSFAITNTGQFGYALTLAVNPTTTSSESISQVFTVKNIEASFVFEANDQINTLEGLTFFLMFIPQGYNVNQSNLPQSHPEWVMSYKFIGSPSYEQPVEGTSNYQSSQQYQPTKVRTRLSRKLYSGDKIVLFVQGYRQGTQTTAINITMSGLVRWWTKSN